MVSRSQFLADKPQVPAETVGFGPSIRSMPFHPWGELFQFSLWGLNGMGFLVHSVNTAA